MLPHIVEGEVKPSDHAPLDFDRYPIGSTLELLPYHSYAAVKMHDRMHVLDDDGRTVLGNYLSRVVIRLNLTQSSFKIHY